LKTLPGAPRVAGGHTARVLPDRAPARPLARRVLSWLDRDTPFQYQLILLPALVMFLFEIVPIIHGIVISLSSFTIWNPEGGFAGFKNYVRVLTNPLFYQYALPNTFMFLGIAVSLEVACGLGVAILINRPFPGARVVKTLLILPLLVAPVVAGLMFYWMFHAEFGLVNQLLAAVGLPGVLWFNRPVTAFAVIILADVWTWTPWFILIIYAGLQSLPPEPFEAARIDGAGPWASFWLITLPLLKSTIVFVVVLSVILSFQVFALVYVMTSGGPAGSTSVLVFYLYQQAFTYFRMGYASAIGFVLFAIIFVLTVLQFKAFGKPVET
jgi:ABC-type sugar transport system permease subunit